MQDDLILLALHSSAVAISPDAVVSVDEDLNIVLFNPGAEAVFGHEARSVLGQPLAILLPERFRHAHPTHIEGFKSSGETVRPMTVRSVIVALHRDGHEFPARAAISRVAAGGKSVMTAVLRDITAERREEERLQLVLGELDHRVKNVLSRISAIVHLAGKEKTSTAEFRQELEGRIRSIARAHDQLCRANWRAVKLRELILDQLEPFSTGENIAAEGPDMELSADAAQAISMVLHELAINAAKYGALSNGDIGRIRVSWRLDERPDAAPSLNISWTESGGPPVAPPGREGAGTKMIRQLVSYELDGSFQPAFEPDGLKCGIYLPLLRVQAAAP